MKKYWHIFFYTILVLALFQSGCSPKNQPTALPDTPTQLPAAAAPTATPLPNAVSRAILLDPAITMDADSLKLSALVYNSLTSLDSAGKPQPALALNWTISEDQLNYIFVLRQDASFHSGVALNADVVLANFNYWFDPQDPSHGSSDFAAWKKSFLGFKGETAPDGTPLPIFDGVEKVDQHTILIHLNRPMPELLAVLADPAFAILNPQVLADHTATVGSSADTVDGTGSYYVSSWTDDGLVLSPNSTFWDEAPEGDLEFPWR